MSTAILSDIHGNREAFAATLADCAERGVTRYVILGDIVGYGPDPDWCTTRVREMAASGAWVVQGNHDAATDRIDDSMNAVARAAIDWTRPRLSPENRAFLAGLPLSLQHSDARGDALFVHASAHSPGDWLYVTGERDAMVSFRSTKARLTFCGHVHVPRLFSCDIGAKTREHEHPVNTPLPLIATRRWLAVAGSIGQPRDGSPQAGWLLWEPQKAQLSFRRTAYDVATTAQKIRDAGLPEVLATRLLAGN